jgi:hypothetical protein
VSARGANVVLTLLLASAACDRILPQHRDETLPELNLIEHLYQQHGIEAQYRYSGNVVEVMVQQPAAQLQRGGQLWARVGPYIYLFSPATRAVIDTFAGIAGVRVVTLVGGAEVARALLVRDRLNEFGWRRARAVLSRALREGTARPTTLQQLVEFGEEHTEFSYSPVYVPLRESRR